MDIKETRGHPFLPRAPRRQHAGINMNNKHRLKINDKIRKLIDVDESKGPPLSTPRSPEAVCRNQQT